MALTNWKRALVAGSIGTGTVLFLRGRRPAGVALAGVGLAVLAQEYPERFEDFWGDLPDLAERIGGFLRQLAELGERVAEEGERQAIKAWEEATTYY
jgi:hypothetical protein